MERYAPHMLVGLAGPRLTKVERSLLQKIPFAGVILFDRNVGGTRELLDLTMEVRKIFRESRGATPLIAADHEGGVVSALARAIGSPPTQMAVAQTGDEKLCDRLFADTARRVRSCGLNMLLGPVADINSEKCNPVIGTRSFGGEEGLVSRLTEVACKALRREGIVACLKHFPGHGATCDDSHSKLAVLTRSLEELKDRDMLPFKKGIDAGAECVMTAHVAPLGRRLPASLDEEVINDVLRSEMGFEGVVVSDALEMGGVKWASEKDSGLGEITAGSGCEHSISEICELALRAGNDLLLFSQPLEELCDKLQGEDSLVKASTCNEPLRSGLSSIERIRALIAKAAAKERDFELPCDCDIARTIALRASRISPAHLEKIPMSNDFSAVFYTDRGAFDLYPIKRFIERVLRSLSRGSLQLLGAPDELLKRMEPAMAAQGKFPDIDSRLFRGKSGNEPGLDIVFLLNRRPLEKAALEMLTAGCRVVVVAGWPFAAELLAPGTVSITTYGAYDAAADNLASFFEVSP